jgi:hypothetical protein
MRLRSRTRSLLAKEAQVIVKQKRYYSIPAKDLKDSFDKKVTFI